MTSTKWEIDPAHSEVRFKAKHLMITTVTGYFRIFNLDVETDDEDFTKASKIIFTADVNSIDTDNTRRDADLKSDDFFNAEQFPELKFTGSRLEKHGDHYDLPGDLTIRDITKPLTVKVEYSGIVTDHSGRTRAGFIVDGELSRKEFGLRWNAITEAGQVVVSDEIKLHCEIELIKQGGEEQVEKVYEEHAVA
jgi:polyisoprenoid-binding protein YceI